MRVKGSKNKSLSSVSDEILELFKNNGKYYLIPDIIRRIKTKVCYNTMNVYLKDLLEKGKIKRIRLGDRFAYG